MSKYGPILLVEDDQDDYEFFKSVLGELEVQNSLLWFDNPLKAMAYLLGTNDQPFIIFCDINLPIQSGVDFKKSIDENPVLRNKSIPFIFYSTADDQYVINLVYTEMTVQGFFKKETSYNAIKSTLNVITDYWKLCRHPNNT